MSTQSLNQEWFNYPGVKENYRTMVYYPGTGGSTFEFNFEGGYINKEDIKAFMVKDDDREAKYLSLTFKGPNTVQTSEPVPVGWTVCIFRDTPKAEPLAKYQDGAVITAENLDRNAQQAMFAVSEMVDRFDSTVSQVEVALKEVYKATQVADEALEEAKKATGIAQSAVSKSDSAIATANNAEATSKAAQQKAEQASQTATEAKDISSALDGQIKAANDTAQDANQTAADAKRIAEGVDGKATQAQSDAAAAVKTATEAKQIAQSIDAKATQAQKDAAEALKTANEALGAIGTVSDIQSRVKSFPSATDIEWKGAHHFNRYVRADGNVGFAKQMIMAADYGDAGALTYKEGGNSHTLKLKPGGMTYKEVRVLQDGDTAPKFDTAVDVRRAGVARLNLLNTSNGDAASMHVGSNGVAYFEAYTGGAIRYRVTLPQAGGTVATQEWVNAGLVIASNNTYIQPPDKTKSTILVDNNNAGVYGGSGSGYQGWLFRVDNTGRVYAHSQLASRGNMVVSGYYGENVNDTVGMYMASNGRGFVSQYVGGKWTGELTFPKTSGTFATEQWVNSQGFVKSSGTKLGPVVTGNSVVLQVADGDGMRVSGYEQMMSQVPGNAVFCGVVFGNIGSRRSGAPKWRVIS